MAFEILLQLFFLIISLAALSYSSKITLESAEKLSNYFKFSQIAVGFIFLSLLTSLPELSVAIFSSATKNNNLSLGDLLGSNVTNIALIFGVFLFFSQKEFSLKRKKINQIILYIFISLVPVLLFIDGSLNFTDGLLLLVLYSFFIKQIWDSKERSISFNNINRNEAAKQFLLFLASIFIVLISAEFAVNAATNIADQLNILKSFIGATLIAFSTSVPELALTITAIKKRYTGFAVGNLIGSNVVNITILLGLNILINPFIPNIEVAFTIFAFIFLSSGYLIYKLLNENKLTKRDGMLLLGMYIIYIISLSSLQIVLQ